MHALDLSFGQKVKEGVYIADRQLEMTMLRNGNSLPAIREVGPSTLTKNMLFPKLQYITL